MVAVVEYKTGSAGERGERQLPLASQHGPGWCFVAYSDLAHRHNDRCVALVHLLNLLIFTRAV